MIHNGFTDEYFMKQAFRQAEMALDQGEVPVGAIIVCQDQIIAKAYNQVEQLNDPTAHAEMLAITSANNFLGSKYLDQCTLYVTLEPCLMCATASYWAQIGKVIFGASDPRRGFLRIKESVLHPKCAWKGGLMENECSEILKSFFKNKRKPSSERE